MTPLCFTVTREHLGEATSIRLDAFLVACSAESRSFLQQQIHQGAVTVNGKPITKPGAPVREGDTVQGDWSRLEPESKTAAVPGELEILFEDAHLLVLNKAQGTVVHPAPSHEGPTLVNHLLHHLEGEDDFSSIESERPGIVHRLDKGTSGVLLIAKNRHVQEKLSALFQNRQIKKTYEAVVWGKLEGQGRYRSKIGRDRVNRLKQSSRTQNGREAITDWKSEFVSHHFTHVKLFPYTGRTHQLRVHLCEDNHPIVGDPLYGRGITESRRKTLAPQLVKKAESLSGTLLHAQELRFVHPISGESLQFQAKRPRVFDEMLLEIREWDT